MNENRKHIDASEVDEALGNAMATLGAFLQSTGKANMRAGIEVAGCFYKIEVTEVESKEVLEAWNGKQS